MSKPDPPIYRMTNWRGCNSALQQRGSLQIWFDPATVGPAAPSGKRGRSARFADAAVQACLTLKALFGLPLRQTTGLVASLLNRAGLEWAVPDFSTLARRQKRSERRHPVSPHHRRTPSLDRQRAGERHRFEPTARDSAGNVSERGLLAVSRPVALAGLLHRIPPGFMLPVIIAPAEDEAIPFSVSIAVRRPASMS